VDQRQGSFSLQEAVVVFLSESLEENLSRIVSSAVIFVFLRRNDSWISDASEVDSELLMVVKSQELRIDLSDSIH